MMKTCNDWIKADRLACHLWWHLGFYLIEHKQFDKVIEIYDKNIRGTKSRDLPDLIDAASLLWRLELLGVDVGKERWQELRECFGNRIEDQVLAINDAHMMMVIIGSGNPSKTSEGPALLKAMRKYCKMTEYSEESRDINEKVGIPICEALLAFANKEYNRVVDLLYNIRGDFYRIGGSHVQLDIFEQTLVEAAIRAGRRNEARALLSEMLRLKPQSLNSMRLTQMMEGRLYG